MMSRCLAVSILLFGICMPAQAAVEIFVSPRGDDAASGTREQPLRTPLAARDAARKLRAKQAAGATIWLTEGRYTLSETLELDANDSGTSDAPLVIRAAPGSNVVLDGGVAIEAGAFRKVEDQETLGRLSPKKFVGTSGRPILGNSANSSFSQPVPFRRS